MVESHSKKRPATHHELPTADLVQPTGLEPVPSRTRPSNVRVCQFRHSCILVYSILRKNENIIHDFNDFVKR